MVSFFIIPQLAFSQTTIKNYDIKVGGIKVGNFSATQIIGTGGIVTYKVDSKVDINLWLYKMQTNFRSKINYENGQISSGRVDFLSNKGDFFTETKKTKSGYQVYGEHKEGKFDRVINEPILMSIVGLYFHEPYAVTKAYAEFYGDFMTLKRLEPGVYHGIVADNEDLFYYENGNLIKTVKKNGFKDLEFVYVNTVTSPS